MGKRTFPLAPLLLASCGLLSASALAQGMAPIGVGNCSSSAAGCSVGSLTVGSVPITTTAALNLFVASTGSDSNPCSSAAAPCLTIQGAVDKVPKYLFHAVNITVGAGNFAGAFVSGFTAAHDGSLVISGTMANVTPATGTATGTFSSSTAGTVSTTTWSTVTDSTQGWTIDDLQGKWVVTTGGTGSGQTKLIASNTATAITVTGVWTTTPNSTTTYAIMEPSSVINSSISYTPWSSTTAVTSGFVFQSNLGANVPGGTNTGTTVNSATSRIAVQQFKFTTTATNIRSTSGQKLTIRRCWFAAAAFGVVGYDGDVIFMYDNYKSSTSSMLAPTSSQPVSYITAGNMQEGSTAVYAASAGVWVSNADYFLGQTSNTLGLGSLAGTMTIFFVGTKIDCSSSGGMGIKGPTGARTAVTVSLVNTLISNCATGIQASGINANAAALTGTGNTIAIHVLNGGTVLINSATTITGTTDINIDGTTSTLANLRGLTPKSIINASWGTLVGEP